MLIVVTLSLSKGDPAPASSPSPGPAMRLDRSRVGIVPGTTETVHVFGAAGQVAVSASFTGVSARYDVPSRALALIGVARGSGTVSLVDAHGATATVAVLVAPPAGNVPADVAVELAGNVTLAFVAARVRDAVAQRSALQPGTEVKIRGLDALSPPPAAGQSMTVPIEVGLDGKGTFVNVTAKSNLRLQIDPPAPPIAPSTLLYSDSPEYVAADGVLFRSVTPAAPGRPVRVYLYHVAMTEPRSFALVLRARGSAARVALTGTTAAPSTKYLCAGHRATADYLRERRRGESVVATVSPDRPFLLPLHGEMHVRQLVAAAYDVAVLDGGTVDVEVVSTSRGVDPASVADDPEMPEDRSRRKGEFSLASVRPLNLELRAGSADDEPSVDVGLGSSEGTPEFPNLRPGPHFFPGDYGIVRPVRLHLVNVTDVAQPVYLYEVPLNRALSTTFWFDGDPEPTEIPAVGDPNQRYLVKSFNLAPHEDRTVTGEYMTDGGSNYTAEYGLTSNTPLTAPPWSCPPSLL